MAVRWRFLRAAARATEEKAESWSLEVSMAVVLSCMETLELPAWRAEAVSALLLRRLVVGGGSLRMSRDRTESQKGSARAVVLVCVAQKAWYSSEKPRTRST